MRAHCLVENMRRAPYPAGKEEVCRSQARRRHPRADTLTGAFGQFKLNRLPGFLLNNAGPMRNVRAVANVELAQPNKVTTTQLAIDGEIEQGQVAKSAINC